MADATEAQRIVSNVQQLATAILQDLVRTNIQAITAYLLTLQERT